MHVGTTRNGRKPHPVAVARKEHGLSLRALAEKTELSHVGISHIETGRNMKRGPNRKTKRLIEEVLGPINWPEPSRNGDRP